MLSRNPVSAASAARASGKIDLPEPQLVSGPRLSKTPEVGLDHAGDLGIAAHGGGIRQLDDRLPAAGHLYGAGGDPVRAQLARCLAHQFGPLEPIALPVAGRGDPVGPGKEGLARDGGELVRLGRGQNAQGRSRLHPCVRNGGRSWLSAGIVARGAAGRRMSPGASTRPSSPPKPSRSCVLREPSTAGTSMPPGRPR